MKIIYTNLLYLFTYYNTEDKLQPSSVSLTRGPAIGIAVVIVTTIVVVLLILWRRGSLCSTSKSGKSTIVINITII